jgi:Skp family chaperone for outer membrane proteins
MKPRTTILAVLALGLALAALALRPATDVPMRIGVYDSRAVAVACANSPSFRTVHAKLMERMKTAKEKGDAKEIAAIEREGMLRQVMMHEQGFGKGSVAAMAALVKDSIAALAVSENLSLVVSKWEVVYSAKDIEHVDVTEKIAGFFGPNEKVKGWLKDLSRQEPIEDAFLIQD